MHDRGWVPFHLFAIAAVTAALFIPISATVRAEDAPLQFSEHLIFNGYAYPYGIAVADLDGDGDLDLTSADAHPANKLYWFENDGKGSFVRRLIQENDPQRLERHEIADLDKDGQLDVVIVKNLYGHLIWFRNPGNARGERLWERNVITTDLPGAYDVAVSDFDGDGDLDVAGSSWVLGNQFAWFENEGASKAEWTKHVIEKDIAETRMIRSADLDRDGDPDLVCTATGAGEVIWYENLGSPATKGWKKHVIDRVVRPMHGQAVDMDADGDLDVLMTAGMAVPAEEKNSHFVAWYENPGKPAGSPWKKHLIASQFPDAIEAVAYDLDGDKDLDVVATSHRSPGRIAWFENTGAAKGSWVEHSLKDNWRSANQMVVADLDGDGRPDIAAVAERGSLEFRWWRNDGRQRAER